ncbi:LGFP repeat-containing protein [Gordonia sp. DT101]|uniref:LGFP repeat-containing protein n=1 Tax=Gordonia sp. DT101 TaxID=3416545 RepID=UPI003CE9F0AF
MRQIASRRIELVAGLFAVALIAAACGNGTTSDDAASQVSSTAPAVSESAAATSEDATTDTAVETTPEAEPAAVKVTGERDVEVSLDGPIAVKYASATDAQKDALGAPLTGDHNAGTRESGVVFQQFQGGVIIAKNDDSGTPAYLITSGKIRDAWNTERAPDGTPSLAGKNGSPGPLGVPTSDVTNDDALQEVSFEHGTVAENTQTGEVTVTVNGKVVPSGLK